MFNVSCFLEEDYLRRPAKELSLLEKQEQQEDQQEEDEELKDQHEYYGKVYVSLNSLTNTDSTHSRWNPSFLDKTTFDRQPAGEGPSQLECARKLAGNGP